LNKQNNTDDYKGNQPKSGKKKKKKKKKKKREKEWEKIYLRAKET
jgi:hypothetical protein